MRRLCPHLSCIVFHCHAATPLYLKKSGHPNFPQVLHMYIRDISSLVSGRLVMKVRFEVILAFVVERVGVNVEIDHRKDGKELVGKNNRHILCLTL